MIQTEHWNVVHMWLWQMCLIILFCFMYHTRMSYPKIIQTRFAAVHSVTTVILYCTERMFSVIKVEPFNNTLKRSVSKLAMFPVHWLSWLAKTWKEWRMINTVLAKQNKTYVRLWLTVWLFAFKSVIRALNNQTGLMSVPICLVTPPSYYFTHAIFSKLKLRGLSPRANYTDRAAAAGRRS